MKRFLVYFILCYQRLLSPALLQSCRYYPTCSNYALWCLDTQGIFFASWNIIRRILRCNQLFQGGIDYPVIKISFRASYSRPCKIKFWFVPVARSSKKFYIIKAI